MIMINTDHLNFYIALKALGVCNPCFRQEDQEITKKSKTRKQIKQEDNQKVRIILATTSHGKPTLSYLAY